MAVPDIFLTAELDEATGQHSCRAAGSEVSEAPCRFGCCGHAAHELEPVAKLLVLHLCRKLCRSLSRKILDPTMVATKAADKVFSSTDFCNSPELVVSSFPQPPGGDPKRCRRFALPALSPPIGTMNPPLTPPRRGTVMTRT